MAGRIRNTKLGGVDNFTNEAPSYQDLNATNDVMINLNLLNKFVSTDATDAQTFTATGTWTKPTGAKLVYVRLWGGGGSGGKGAVPSTGKLATGGSGGGYGELWFNADDLTATVAVTIGSGGAATTTTGDGAAGGASSFGSYATVGGGSAGRYVDTGNISWANSSGTSLNSIALLTSVVGVVGASSSYTRALSINGLYSAAGSNSTGGSSIYGGAGGGGLSDSESSNAGGTSVYGGNGGASGNPGTAGTIPAGGGGAGGSTNDSGAGARGQVEVYTF